jgi:hypothetical protein
MLALLLIGVVAYLLINSMSKETTPITEPSVLNMASPIIPSAASQPLLQGLLPQMSFPGLNVAPLPGLDQVLTSQAPVINQLLTPPPPANPLSVLTPAETANIIATVNASLPPATAPITAAPVIPVPVNILTPAQAAIINQYAINTGSVIGLSSPILPAPPLATQTASQNATRTTAQKATTKANAIRVNNASAQTIAIQQAKNISIAKNSGLIRLQSPL